MNLYDLHVEPQGLLWYKEKENNVGWMLHCATSMEDRVIYDDDWETVELFEIGSPQYKLAQMWKKLSKSAMLPGVRECIDRVISFINNEIDFSDDADIIQKLERLRAQLQKNVEVSQ